MQHCGEVLGIEIIPDAIKDAKENVIKNGITNCEFFVGKAEDILSPVIQRATKPNITAIVDPPRAGLRKLYIYIVKNKIYNISHNVKEMLERAYLHVDFFSRSKGFIGTAQGKKVE